MRKFVTVFLVSVLFLQIFSPFPAMATDTIAVRAFDTDALEAVVISVIAGTTVMDGVFLLYNRHRIKEENPNKITGVFGIVSGVLCGTAGAMLLSASGPGSGAVQATGGAMIALGVGGLYYGLSNVRQPVPQPARSSAADISIRPTVICSESEGLVPGVAVTVTF